MLDKAILVATDAHQNQVDKGDKPYILHPLRVMLKMETEEEMICAVLHDVIEDSPMSEYRLREIGFSDEIVDIISILTKGRNEKYFDYIDRVKTNPIATKIKIADLKDNMDINRLKNLTHDDFKRLEKYDNSLVILGN